MYFHCVFCILLCVGMDVVYFVLQKYLSNFAMAVIVIMSIFDGASLANLLLGGLSRVKISAIEI